MKEFNVEDFMAEYLSTGAYMFDGSKVLEKYNPENITCDNRDWLKTPAWEDYIKPILDDIKKEFLKPFDVTLGYDFTCSRVIGNVRFWHSDAEYVIPGQNATINCFFDEMSPEIGGNFNITPYREELHKTNSDTEEMCITYPKKHSIIIFNQNRNWMHRACEAISPRRMVSIAATFHEFNQIHRNLIEC